MWKITDPKHGTMANRCLKHCLVTLAAMMIAFSSVAAEGIRPETRERVKQALAKYPNFKLTPDEKQCLNGEIKDPECDELVNDAITVFINRLEAHEMKRQVNMARKAVESIDIARALLQTVIYREFGQAPTEDDYRTKVQGDATMRPEVRALIQRNLLEPRPKGQPDWKNDLPQAMVLAKDYIDSAIGIQKKLTDKELATNVGKMNANFLNYYQAVKQKISPGR